MSKGTDWQKWYDRYSAEVECMTKRYEKINSEAEVKIHKITDEERKRFEEKLNPKPNRFALDINKIINKDNI